MIRADVLEDDGGFTTAGMVVALLLSMTLIFTTAQVYRIGSVTAQAQDVADVAALAAQNEVAEFMTVVRVCDALVLSMTLLGSLSFGAGTVALCVPSVSALGGKLIEIGGKVFDARDRFARKSAEGLNKLQRALPFLAAARAAEVAAGNGASDGVSYSAAAVLVPFEGEEIVLGDSSASDALVQEVESQGERLSESARKAEDAAVRALEAKERAFRADCGAYPDRCQYERASRLANLDADDNPLYQSIDTWSFSVALRRATAYYQKRHAIEAPSSQSVAEQANSAVRKAFYAYAVEEFRDAYVYETPDAFEAYFPFLASNTDEMRATPLYTEDLWPVGSTGDGPGVMHAYAGCPGIAGAVSRSSLRQLEQGTYVGCSVCGFGVSDVGNVAAASSSISNGFEYHYRIIATAVREYEQARDEARPHIREAQSAATGIFDRVLNVVRTSGETRISAKPPGSLGTVAFVVSESVVATDAGFESSFSSQAGSVGARVAMSGATMIEEASGEGRSVLSSLLDGFKQEGGAAVGAAGTIIACWSILLESYGEGQRSLSAAIGRALDDVPLVGASGLGEWAAGKLEGVAEDAGLQPADLDALKAVSVNTVLIVERDSGSFSQGIAAAKDAAARSSAPSGDVLSIALAGLRGLMSDRADALGGSFEVARVELPIGEVSMPITVALPESVGHGAHGVVDAAFDAVESLRGGGSSGGSWQ